ncbi:helix-turn-helix domain-containing protein [Caballeronia sp. LZ016]|uniref:helix-turn-helix domain-containing protein n=1 Tax=Caballeronia sp. LZ016 TaxID=3038554 RepID=UPI0028629B94|nr:helix-turn-helix domain-containing protein [Caballeronia sp. LZ016]MDR5741398.1 helix-turn-helix domain-containing protein [Caballeronia sp. LZ016]
MNEVARIIAVIKRHLKAQGLTYRAVAHALELSEPSVKRLFSSERFTVERLAQVSALLGFTLAELTNEAASVTPRRKTLTHAQEAQLVANRRLLLVAVCALNHWTVAEIVGEYRITHAQCLEKLLKLERMGLIMLMPGDRIRLLVERDFHWLPGGPIRRFFMEEALPDFVASDFDHPRATMEFAHAMLTEPAIEQLRGELLTLRARVAELHAESAKAPIAHRRGIGMLLGAREWEPAAFADMRGGKRSRSGKS